MSLTFPASFIFQNAADTATITAPNSLPLTPPSLLQDQHIGRKWRTQTDLTYLTIDLGQATTIDTVGLFGLNLTTAGTVGLRLSLTDPSAQDGALGAINGPGAVSAYYGAFVGLLSTPVNPRYLRIDLTQSGISYIEAGFLMIGLRNQVGVNFAIGAQDTPVDPSIMTKSRSGATWIDPRTKYRSWNFSFDFLTKTERMGWVEDMDRLCGASRNVMMVRDCSSSNLGRDSICGLITDGSPVISRDGYGSDGLPMYSKAYKIEQRL